MILDEKISVIPSGKLITHLKNKGYEPKYKENILINPVDLPKSSTYCVNAKCDNCDKIVEIKYNSYIKNTNNYVDKYICKTCKYKKTINDKYGVDNISQLQETKNKIKKTNVKKYGSEQYFSSKDFKTKNKTTLIEKYGVDHISKLDETKEKIKHNSLKNYGVDNVLKSEEIKEKIKQTNLEKYGHKHHMSSESVLNKVFETNIEKYGKKTFSQTNKYKNKITDNIYSKYNKIIGNKYKILSYKDFILDIQHNDHSFKIHTTNLVNRHKYGNNICTICNPIEKNSSNIEETVKEWVLSLKKDITIITNDRKILEGKEIDIYIPDLNLAIEFNGIYWHSEKFKDKRYHLEKTLKCKEKDIDLIHIFEDDWLYKRNILESIIRNKLNVLCNKIYARKCIIKEVSSKKAREFLDDNHIQGFSKSKYKLGLYHNNELVSLMTFGYRKTNSKKEFELIRFCNKLNTSVIGSASKLFKYFIKNYRDKITESYILSYADVSMFNGTLYKSLGFGHIHRSEPNYFWVVGKIREHRWKYNKQNLIKEGFDSGLTEIEIMHQRGYYRIYGCGQDRYEYLL